MSKTVIIGGGIIGLATAWELRRRGTDVLILDARTPGMAASAANAGYIVMTHAGPVPSPGLVRQSIKWMLNPESPLYIRPRLSPSFLHWLYRFWRACNTTTYQAGLDATTRLRAGAERILDQWINEGVEFEMHSTGRIFAYSKHQSMEADLRSFDGSPYQQPSPLYGDDLRQFEPVLSDEIVAGFLVAEDRTVQPNSLTRGLVTALESAGVDIRSGTPVVDLETRADIVVSVRTPWESIAADHVVIAAGAWSADIGKMAGVRLPIESGKGYGLDFVPAPVRPQRSISLKDVQIAVSPFDDGLRLGGTMEMSGINDMTAARRVAAIERGGKRYLRGIPEDARPNHVWSGMRPMAPDGLPVMGLLRGYGNLSIAGGHSMLGVTLAPTTAVLMAELINSGVTPDIMKPFSPDRFRGIL